MRFHRYGKYGPDAWLHRRKRRFSPNRFLPVLAAPTAVVLARNPVDEERIITIVQGPNQYSSDFEPGNESNNQTTFPEQGLLDAPQNKEEEETAEQTKLRKQAEFKADKYFGIIEQKVKDQGEGWPLNDAIAREAKNQANIFLEALFQEDPALDIDASRKFYIQTYTKQYQRLYEQETSDKGLPTEKTSRLIELAASDAKEDREQNRLSNGPTEQELNVLAILRVQEVYIFVTGFGTGQIKHLLSHVDLYKRSYREEVRRLARTEAFPNTGGQSRRYPGA